MKKKTIRKTVAKWLQMSKPKMGRDGLLKIQEKYAFLAQRTSPANCALFFILRAAVPANAVPPFLAPFLRSSQVFHPLVAKEWNFADGFASHLASLSKKRCGQLCRMPREKAEFMRSHCECEFFAWHTPHGAEKRLCDREAQSSSAGRDGFARVGGTNPFSICCKRSWRRRRFSGFCPVVLVSSTPRASRNVAGFWVSSSSLS